MFMSKTVICVVYVDYCLFWARSQYEIDKFMNYCKECGPSYNYEHSKGQSVSDFLVIYTKILDNGIFQFYLTRQIRKVLKPTGMEHYNGVPISTKVEENLGTY